MKKITKFRLTVSSISLLTCNLNAQIITTYAGTGGSGYSGDGVSATLASLSTPHAIAADAGGNLFIADALNNRIRKISPSGIISTIAGNGSLGYSGDGGPATAATLNHPFEIALDPQSTNVYIGDIDNYVIRKVNASGIISTVAGTGTRGYSGDGGQATAARLNGASGVALDRLGNLYISDGGNHCIRKVSTSGIITTIAGIGTVGFGGDGGPATAARLNYPGFLFIDANKNVFVSDNGNHRVRKIDSNGIITTVVGNGSAGYSGDGGPATAAALNFTSGVDFDASGNMYIGDYSNECIRKINTSGIISTFAGNRSRGYSGDGGVAISAELNRPTDIALAGCDKLYICDMGNERIRVVNTADLGPSFLKTDTISFVACENVVDTSINRLLSALDINSCQTLTWSVIEMPRRGSLIGFPAVKFSNGDTLKPTGVSYTPNTGFLGKDTFVVKVTDGRNSDTLKVYPQVKTTALCTTSLVEVSDNEFGKYVVTPNPTNGYFLLSTANINTQEMVEITVYNQLGVSVYNKKTALSASLPIELNVASGLYILSIKSPSHQEHLRVMID
jgi:sugar lactone lactonase YvrE